MNSYIRLKYFDLQANGVKFENLVLCSERILSDSGIRIKSNHKEEWVANDEMKFDRGEKYYRTQDERMHGMGVDEILDFIKSARDAQS